MTAHNVIETLIDMTLIESDVAARRLGGAVRASQESQEKNALLLNYRQEYVDKLQATLATGLSVQQHRNYQEFIRGLDRAISQQKQICMADQDKVLVQKSLWQQCERKRLSYATLSNRARSLEKKLEDKRDQKNTDEFATRQYCAQR